MKRLFSITALLLISSFIIPALLVRGTPLAYMNATPTPMALAAVALTAPAPIPDVRPSVQPDDSPPPETSSEPPVRSNTVIDKSLTVRVKIGDDIKHMQLNEYLYGVVAGEMPAMFPEEALKAQAVAARTFTIYRIQHAPHPKHTEADVCDSPNCCKAYLDIDAEKAGWGSQAEMYAERYYTAVNQTDGEVVVYEDKPIMAVFHASSYSQTERCADVWGEDLPYLQSVASPDEELGKTVTQTVKQARALLKSNWPDMDLKGDAPKDWFGSETHTEGGGVMKLTIGGVEVTGSKLRSVLGLSSTHFTVSFLKNSVVWESKGYGHGVGLSQYGAKALALDGKNYRDILAWYYVDTAISQLDEP